MLCWPRWHHMFPQHCWLCGILKEHSRERKIIYEVMSTSAADSQCQTATQKRFPGSDVLPHSRKIDVQRMKKNLTSAVKHREASSGRPLFSRQLLVLLNPTAFSSFSFLYRLLFWNSYILLQLRSKSTAVRWAEGLQVINNQYLWLHINFTPEATERGRLDFCSPHWLFLVFCSLGYTWSS